MSGQETEGGGKLPKCQRKEKFTAQQSALLLIDEPNLRVRVPKDGKYFWSG